MDNSSMHRSESSSNSTQTDTILPVEYRFGLVFLYVLVFIGGTLGAIIMCKTLNSNMLSFTKVSVINLLVVHMVFLLTVPFRIYYYASGSWMLGLVFCKMVSIMLHMHMYLSFIFYAIILCIRFLDYFQWRHRLEFYRELHAVIASVTIWAIIILAFIPFIMNYGSRMSHNNTQCFGFGATLHVTSVKVINYIICSVVLLSYLCLAPCQCYILWCVCRKHGQDLWSHQEVWVQIKSLFFVLIMLVCFVPYQAFRVYYAYAYQQELEKVNEVFLAVTAFSCFDMLVFAGREMWRPVYKMCCVS